VCVCVCLETEKEREREYRGARVPGAALAQGFKDGEDGVGGGGGNPSSNGFFWKPPNL